MNTLGSCDVVQGKFSSSRFSSRQCVTRISALHLDTPTRFARRQKNIDRRTFLRASAASLALSTSASCILANMSMQLGRSLERKPLKQEVVGDEQANRLLRRPYRTPWVHPEV